MLYIMRQFTECDFMVNKHSNYLNKVQKMKRMLVNKKRAIEAKLLGQ